MINKSTLKNGYYWEYTNFYNSLPKELPIFSKEILLQQINKGVETEEQMMAGRKWLSRKEATSFGAQVVRDGDYKDSKFRIFFFEDEENGGKRSILYVYLYGDGPRVRVYEFDSQFKWGGGLISYSRNESMETLTSDTETLLTLPNFLLELKTLIEKYE